MKRGDLGFGFFFFIKGKTVIYIPLWDAGGKHWVQEEAIFIGLSNSVVLKKGRLLPAPPSFSFSPL